MNYLQNKSKIPKLGETKVLNVLFWLLVRTCSFHRHIFISYRFSPCSCSISCSTDRCQCKKKRILYNSKCHKSLTCSKIENIKVMAWFYPYVFRLTLQHKAIYCYLVLSIWIFILLGGMYNYLKTEDESLMRATVMHHTTQSLSYDFDRSNLNQKQISKLCNPPNNIYLGSEYFVNSNYSLIGILILIRHGDRGPLTHVRNITHVNCAGPRNTLYSSYEEYIDNITGSATLSQIMGMFHGLPPLPNVECNLGQLTIQGAIQLLITGKLLRAAYTEVLGINNNTNIKKDIIAYSTKYRRTLQSSLAFLYAFLAKNEFSKLTIQESQSLAFCFDDCACPAADKYYNLFMADSRKFMHTQRNLQQIINKCSSIVYEIPDHKISTDPHALRDALLSYVCHGAKLPCSSMDKCVSNEQVTALFSFLEWKTRKLLSNDNMKKGCLLRAYGLVKHIVSQLLRLISENHPKVVLYSGHDKTIHYLTVALGVLLESTVAPNYASRLIFEVYRHKPISNDLKEENNVSNYYFRLLHNGKDITNQMEFCKPLSNYSILKGQIVNTKKKKYSIYLCSVESIIRYLHEDYFTPFNATNVKDACNV